MRYWIAVVSREHVLRGVKGGFVQACHGKKGPLSRMKEGDFLIYYSPKLSMEGVEKCQKFTALGKVVDEKVYAFDMGGGFVPHRIDLEYFPVKEVSILPLLDKLSFTSNTKNWGMKFRFGFFEILKEDFLLIASEMHFKGAL